MGFEVKFDHERSVGRVPVASTSARIGSGDPLPLVMDISPVGLKALFPVSVDVGSTLALEITHPALEIPIMVEGEVRWSRPDPEKRGALVGLSFRAIVPAARARLAQLIAHELGRRVLVGGSAVGFASAGGDSEGALFLYDGTLKPKAFVKPERGLFKIECFTPEPTEEGEEKLAYLTSTLDAAIRLAYDREGPVRFEPPL